MPDMGIYMMVPEMWEHYATNHLVLPTDQERELVMAADPDTAIGNMKNQFFSRERAGVPVLYVERIDGEYSHKIGNKPDTEFINKLERLVGGIAPWARTF